MLKRISEAATGMAQFVSERLGVSERVVPKWSHGGRKEELIQLNQRDMAECEGLADARVLFLDRTVGLKMGFRARD
jgi:hypothetical protein